MPFPDGHFYSPVVDPDEIRRQEDRIWPDQPLMPGVDLRGEEQRRFIHEQIDKYYGDFDYPVDQAGCVEEYDFFLKNGLYEQLDPVALFTMLRKYEPKRMIEVGSGFSSLLTADVNRRWFDNRLEFACIEPYPREFLKKGVPGIEHLIESKVEDVDLRLFDTLRPNDILFIDSSHVCKTGSDVNFLYFEVIPRIRPGVLIHIHDIFFPHEYPRDWVVDENRSWNEQYLLRAMLMFSEAFEVQFGCAYAQTVLGSDVEAACGQLLGGGAFWMRKVKCSCAPYSSTTTSSRTQGRRSTGH